MIRPVIAVCIASVLGACASAPPPPAPRGPQAPTTWVRPPRPSVGKPAAGAEALPRVQDTLSNGLRVVVVPRRGLGTVSTRLVFLQGAATEPASARGSTLLAVALLGDLYEKYPTGAPIPGEETLRAKVWYKGAAYTWDVGHDYATIGVDGYASDVQEYLEWIGDAVARPRRGDNMFVARRDATIHGLEDIELGDDANLRRVLERAAFGREHPYARSLHGTRKSLERIAYEDVTARQDALLDPRRSVLLVVGDVDSQSVLRTAEKQLHRLVGPKVAAGRAEVGPVRRARGSNVALIPQPQNALMTVCAVGALRDEATPDIALEGLAELLGGGLRSRLLRKLRIEPGLVYFAFSQPVLRRSARALITCTRTPTRATAEVVTRMKAVFAEVMTAPPSGEELDRVRAQLMAGRRGERSSRGAVTASEIERLARGAQGTAEVASLSGEQIQAAAAQVLADGAVRFILAGPEIPAVRAAAAAGLGRVQKVSVVW